MSWTALGPPTRYCDQKLAYTRAEARTAAKRLEAQTGHRIVPYYCPSCGAYHCGSAHRRQETRGARPKRWEPDE
jgi:hypothetical protein